ncbi:MAG: hypothetical protein OXI43_02740 [Candidatus Poribacteria bacterium]|nr:hypothetical protein [Candidatus Poribacteria bacterium]
MNYAHIENGVLKYQIEVAGVETCGMNKEAAHAVSAVALGFATGIKIGQNEERIFKTYASQLERFFGAKISTYSPPTDIFDHYRLLLPLRGYFDDSPERFCILFRITRARYSSTQ